MFIFRAQIITLLLFIGYQRSTASPTTYSPTETASTLTIEPISHDDVLQTIDEKGGETQDWDCTADSNYVQEQIALTTTMLDEGYKITESQKDMAADEIVLVLGKAGSGKTSLVQFLIQNPKLQSKKVRTETGEFIIDDGEKIGTSATESFTLYPELVNFNSTMNFCDSPGFHDSRSSAHEIVSMDIMKSITRRFKKVKILLLEKYGSLQYGVSKDSFLNTLRHLNDFLVDFDRYKDHIALIATKIPFMYRMADDGVVSEFITEEMHVESIIEYLNHTETSLTEKLTKKVSRKEEEFYRKVIRLLQSLQTRNEDGKASKINVFRRPYKSGPLKSMALLDKNKESLSETIMNLGYVEVKNNDFDFTLSDKAKLYLECLLKLSNDNYKNKINELSFKLREYVNLKTQNYTSFYQILSDLDFLHNGLKKLSENLDETNNYNEFFKKIQSFISEQNIQLEFNYNDKLQTLEKIEGMLLKFIDTSNVFIPSSWSLPIKHLVRSVEDEHGWYKTLDKYIEKLSSYETQRNKSEIYSAIFHNKFTMTSNLMAVFVDATESKNARQFIDAQADTKKKLEIETTTKTLLQPSNITCDTNGRLIVKGFQVRLSEINSKNIVHSYCNNITVKEVALLAVDSVFLDEDTTDMFQGVNLFIAAPKWEVIGQRKIVLSGKTGSEITENPLLDNGRDGKPGLPGGNGGSFVGIGMRFSNGNSLLVESNGGRGGPGADGAKGETGASGRNAVEKMKLMMYKPSKNYTFTKGVKSDNLRNILLSSDDTLEPFHSPTEYCGCTYSTTVQLIMEEGDCGRMGGPGGYGGEAGIGGILGEQELVELSDSSQIKFESQNGSMGARGSVGEIGDRGQDGIGMICIQVVGSYGSYIGKSYWKCEPTDSSSPECVRNKTEPNFDHQVFTSTGMQQPSPRISPDFTYYSLDYAILLNGHSNHIIFKKIITDFKDAIMKKFSYNLNEMGLLFFKNNLK